MKTLKRTLAIVLTLIMAFTMFAGVVFAEDAITEDATEEVVDTSYTWTPYKGVSAYKSTKTTETTTENVDTASAPKAGTTYEDLGTVDNGDGTVTTTILGTTITLSDNGDGTTAVTTKKETEKTVAEKPDYINNEFSYKIFSNRVNAPGFVDCTDFKAKQVYSDSKEMGYKTATNKTWNNESVALPVMPEDDNGRYHHTTNNGGSFYTFAQKSDVYSARVDSVMYVSRANNDMWLEFTAPSDGVYSASGLLSQHKVGGVEDDIEYKFVRVDANGNRINLTNSIPIAARTATDAEKKLTGVKVELEKGEKLVITTHQLSAGGVRKVFLDGYTVTKLEYSEADDNTTVTTNYSYKNYNYEKIYGDSYAVNLPKNYENVWDMNAVRYAANGGKTASAAMTIDSIKDLDRYAAGALSNNTTTWCANTGTGYGQYIQYDSTADSLLARLTNRYCKIDNVDTLFNYGFQFIFTVPEDGDAKITAPQFYDWDGKNLAISIRYGVKKADADAVEYVAPTSTVDGSIIMWHTMTTEGNEFSLKDLKAGDQIYLEITSSGTGNGGDRRCYLDSLNVALTTKNSPVDVTGDFEIDATDAIFMRRHLLRSLTGKVAELDITGDSIVNLRDLVRLKKALSEEV